MDHGAELEQRELAAVQTHAPLPIENRTAAGQLDEQRDNDHHRHRDQQANGCDEQVEPTLQDRVPADQRRLAKRENRHAVQIADIGPDCERRIDLGHQPHVGHAVFE